MTIGMAKRTGRKKRTALAIAACILLVGLAVALGALWSLYRAYPFKWQDEVKANAARYGQDPLFIAAIIRTESGWRQYAVSSVGATGLMQIMPDTGGWIASQNGWEYSEGQLSDAAANIRLGCWYVDYLDRKFEGDKMLMLAAYNAGESKVLEWRQEGRFGEGGTGIPYPETRNFVRKVMDAYEKYRFLYKNQ
jgi:soluble lytic murein transglycosylase